LPNSKAYRLYHHTTHQLFELFHVKFIEWKDDTPCPLYPGRVIDLPSTDTPGNPDVVLQPTPLVSSSSAVPASSSVSSSSSSSISSSSMPKHTIISDEEELINDAPGQVWTVPDNDDEVPVPICDDPTDVVPVGDLGNVPHCSAKMPVPMAKTAEHLGIKHLPCVTQAITESCEAGRHLKEQRVQAKFE